MTDKPLDVLCIPGGSGVNALLEAQGAGPVDWRIQD